MKIAIKVRLIHKFFIAHKTSTIHGNITIMAF